MTSTTRSGTRPASTRDRRPSMAPHQRGVQAVVLDDVERGAAEPEHRRSRRPRARRVTRRRRPALPRRPAHRRRTPPAATRRGSRQAIRRCHTAARPGAPRRTRPRRRSSASPSPPHPAASPARDASPKADRPAVVRRPGSARPPASPAAPRRSRRRPPAPSAAASWRAPLRRGPPSGRREAPTTSCAAQAAATTNRTAKARASTRIEGGQPVSDGEPVERDQQRRPVDEVVAVEVRVRRRRQACGDEQVAGLVGVQRAGDVPAAAAAPPRPTTSATNCRVETRGRRSGRAERWPRTSQVAAT